MYAIAWSVTASYRLTVIITLLHPLAPQTRRLSPAQTVGCVNPLLCRCVFCVRIGLGRAVVLHTTHDMRHLPELSYRLRQTAHIKVLSAIPLPLPKPFANAPQSRSPPLYQRFAVFILWFDCAYFFLWHSQPAQGVFARYCFFAKQKTFASPSPGVQWLASTGIFLIVKKTVPTLKKPLASVGVPFGHELIYF